LDEGLTTDELPVPYPGTDDELGTGYPGVDEGFTDEGFAEELGTS
jgi:hypothetical protein